MNTLISTLIIGVIGSLFSAVVISAARRYGPSASIWLRNVGIGPLALLGISSVTVGALAVALVSVGTILESESTPGNCFEVPEHRVKFIDKGSTEIELDPTESNPIVLNFLDSFKLVGSMKFNFLNSNSHFDITAVVDSNCLDVGDYEVWDWKEMGQKHVVRGNETLPIWSELLVPFGGQNYEVTLAREKEDEFFTFVLNNSLVEP